MPARDAVAARDLVQPHHTVRDTLQLHITAFTGAIVEQQNRGFAAGKELLEGQQLAAVTHRIRGEQTKLRKRIDHEPRRFLAFDQVGQLPIVVASSTSLG